MQLEELQVVQLDQTLPHATQLLLLNAVLLEHDVQVPVVTVQSEQLDVLDEQVEQLDAPPKEYTSPIQVLQELAPVSS